MKDPLSPEQEALAAELAAVIADAARDDILEVARALASSSTASLFGETEFKVRDIVLRIAAKAYEQHLSRKKTATSPPA
jgi:hypothetical protein